MKECEFVVIGAGIAGASAAFELATHGRVILLERESQPGYHTTGRSAATFFESYGDLTIRRLSKASRAFFEHPPEGFTEHPLLAPRGALYIAREEQRSLLSETLHEIKGLTPGVRELSVEQAIERVPVLRQDYIAAALYEPDAMDIDVDATHQGFLRGATRRGAEIVTNAEVLGASKRGGRWVVETQAGSFAGNVVVNAAGAWCDELAKLAGVRPVGLIPKRRTAITFDAPSGVDPRYWPLFFDVAGEFYCKPEGGRILASPADETPMPPCDAQPEELDVAVTVDRVEKATTLQVSRITHKWAGLRSFVADKSLVIGMDDEAEGFFWLAGQGGYGIQTSPAAARAVAGLLIDGRLPDELLSQGLKPVDLAPGRLSRGQCPSGVAS